ncbi:MAG: hypothetical protein CM15mP127_04140 [Gammaproteobacteria bacterium]|nr:MAG: hypothetical protein CM15mP127_04140 [Gammaproteobacteria bacterium]
MIQPILTGALKSTTGVLSLSVMVGMEIHCHVALLGFDKVTITVFNSSQNIINNATVIVPDVTSAYG